MNLNKNHEANENNRDSNNSHNSTEDESEIYIHIIGEVQNQGLIALKQGQRIIDAIEKAGGVTQQADLSKVNLAFVLSDGQKVRIPSVNDKEENIAYVTDETYNALKKNANIVTEKINNDNPYKEIFIKDMQDKLKMTKYILKEFDFNIINNLTIMNSHGDYSVQQLIYNDKKGTTVIDFETAKSLPIIWEVMRSYSYIDKEAKDGNLNIDTLINYVKEFSKYVKLNKYDLKYAGWLYLIQIVGSTFGYKQYNDDYSKTGLLEFALFRTKLCRYLYNNAEKIGDRLLAEINN